MASDKTKIIRPQAGFQERFVRSNLDLVIAGGVLNPQPVDSLVFTPKGFVSIGSLRPGDAVCDIHGGVQVVNFVIDKGALPCVEFTLDDGRKVESALSHNWRVSCPHRKIKDIPARDIVEYIDFRMSCDNKHRGNYRIRPCEPVFINDAYSELRTVDPYVLGCLIGDGWFSEGKFYIGFATQDVDIVDEIRRKGYDIKKERCDDKDIRYEIIDKNLKHLIEDLGLLGKHSGEKFVPDCYKYAPEDVRIEILQGLFDTDGHCSHTSDNRYVAGYRTVSRKLCGDVKWIIESLGGKCYICKTESIVRKYNDYRGKYDTINCSDSYGLRVVMPDNRNLFKLERKRINAQYDSERKVKLGMSIKSYRMTGIKHCVCINVSGDDHMYITNGFIPTCNCGKTAAAVLSVAEPSDDPNFRAVFLRNNLGDLRAAGSIIDTFKDFYGDSIRVVESGEPLVEFPSGARIDITHVSDQSRDKVMQRFKGRQYDFIYFDEGTGFTWECFTTIYTRNRGRAAWTGKVRMTTNPERDHWLRTFLDWYIGVDGFIREDREGTVRYFYINGESVKDVVWGDSKDEVYRKCKVDIDRKLAKINGKTGTATYKDMIKSFTFYLGRISENKASMGGNAGYVGSVAVSGGRTAQQLIEGNWNVSANDELNVPITSEIAMSAFMSDPKTNGDKWITCDLADTGTDNFIAVVWDGLHVIDMVILGHTTPRMNAERLQMMAKEHKIADSHIIFDAIRGTYINDYIPEAVPFISYRGTMGVYANKYMRLKDECYGRLVAVLKNGDLSFDESVADRIYEHQNLHSSITIQAEFVAECQVVRFKDMASGKKQLIGKKDMNAMLGNHRSMDLLDPIAMRMMPMLEYPNGEELKCTVARYSEDDDDEGNSFFRNKGHFNIYKDDNWY